MWGTHNSSWREMPRVPKGGGKGRGEVEQNGEET